MNKVDIANAVVLQLKRRSFLQRVGKSGGAPCFFSLDNDDGSASTFTSQRHHATPLLACSIRARRLDSTLQPGPAYLNLAV